MKFVHRLVSDDRYAFEVHDLAIDPAETKAVAGTYTRE